MLIEQNETNYMIQTTNWLHQNSQQLDPKIYPTFIIKTNFNLQQTTIYIHKPKTII